LKDKIIWIFAFTALLAAIGCSSTIASLTVASTKNVDLSGGTKEVGRAEEATDGRGWILFIPLGGAPSIDNAMNKVIEKNDGDYLTNVKIEQGGWSILAFSRGWLTVKGDVWQTGRAKAPPQPASAPESPAPAAETSPEEDSTP
jgi:hypothetical protein